MAQKKAFVRYAGNKAVPGSLIVRTKAPKVGTWKEVPYDVCCGGNSGECVCTTGTLSLSYSLGIGQPPSIMTGFGINCPVSGFECNVFAGLHMSNWVTDNGGDVNAIAEYLNIYFSQFGTWSASEGEPWGTVTLNFNSCSQAPFINCESPLLQITGIA